MSVFANSSARAQILASVSDNASIQAAGRGKPYINFGDGHEVLTSYSASNALQGSTSPLSMASADFDEDGVPDLISGYSAGGAGMIVLHRGNIDSIQPNAPEAQHRKAGGSFSDSPFLSPARVFDLPQAADFAGAGDFDADGHWDVVTASRVDNTLYLLAGDGHGGFSEARRIELPGRVTALATGEINRADGLTDIVVGVAAADGPKALVFEGPEGALRAGSETFTLTAEAASFALGRLDDDYTMDLAIAAGSELTVVLGRDRKLSLDEARQKEVFRATVSRRAFSFGIRSVAVGDFKGDHKTGVSLLSDQGSVHLLTPAPPKKAKKKKKAVSIESWKDETLATGNWQQATTMIIARVSSAPCDDLVILDSASRKLHIIASSRAGEGIQAENFQPVSFDVDSEPMAVMPMRLNSDALSDLVVLRNGQVGPTAVITQAALVFPVSSNADSGAGSLRDAITQANANAGLDTISFGISVGPQTITPLSPLPAITEAVVIDGTTQTGFAGNPIIELNGSSAGGFSTNGFDIAAGNSTVRGLVINRFPNRGIHLTVAGGNVVEGDFLGTDIIGTADLGNAVHGISMFNSPNNIIGGLTGAARNVISGNDSFGVSIENTGSTGNQVIGNFIGTDVNGVADIGNSGHGVLVTVGSGNTVGGTTGGARNIVSGNGADGIRIDNGATSTLVQGNFVGTDVSGDIAIGNVRDGVDIVSAPNNTVGGTTIAARNVLSGSNGGFFGVAINLSASAGNLVQGNLIGTNANGTTALPNSGGGVFIGNSPPASNNAIGGTAAVARNVISGNNGSGVLIGGGATGNQVQGNFIGTDLTGTGDLGNTQQGVLISNSPNNTIGGNGAGSRNVISGNNVNGILVISPGATGNQILGNYIGVDATGTATLGNGDPNVLGNGNGVSVNNAPNNILGGLTLGAGNLISGNVRTGVSIQQANSIGNQVQGNFIGTDLTGTLALGNGGHGVALSGSSNGTVSGNLISGNGNSIGFGGLVIVAAASIGPGTGNNIQGNLIGTDVSGTAAVGNHSFGVALAAPNNFLGGTTAAARNVISGNGNEPGFAAVFITGTSGGATGSGSVVQGNFIGTAADGTSPLGNVGEGFGISVIPGFAFSNVTLGGTANGAGNVIAFNSENGAVVFSGTGHSILSNSIFSNGKLGIDLSNVFPSDGATPNDACDTEAGPNNIQNSPVLTTVFPSGNHLAIQGTLNSTANTTLTIQFFANSTCDPSGFGEGEQFLGSTQVTTDVSCNASFSFLADSVAPGQSITATATDAAGNTSEFSNCIAIGAGALNVAITKTASPTAVRPGDKVSYTIAVTNKGPAIATNVELTDILPAQLTFVSCSATSGSCGGSGNSRSLNLPLLALNATATLTIEATVNPSVANGTVINNTATVTASLGETSTTTATANAPVTVSTQAPAITCPSNVLAATAQGQTSTFVNYPAPTLAANPPNVVVSCVPPSGSTFPLGTTAVNCTATDAANNISSCSFTVTVNQGNPSLDQTDVDFGDPIALPNQNPPTDTFTITNASADSVDLSLASIQRTGSDVGGRITNPDDSGFFTLFAINPGGADTQLSPGSTIPIPAGQRNFRVMFNPSIPAVASGTSNLSASQVLPEVVTSSVNFNVSGGGSLTVNLTGRVAAGVRLIDPVNPTRSPVVTFRRSGNQFNLTYSVFDSNLNVSRASYQFLDGGGQPSGQPVEVNLAQALQAINLVRGQSF
ncbi:MAG: FG-GAP-like repeat-containing protein, partial [Blastocatellia bacterium]